MANEVRVATFPDCDFCQQEVAPGEWVNKARYDGKTRFGPWANMCERHFRAHGVGLGTGKGQKLVLQGQ